MLAYKFDESRVDWSQPVYIQAKLDGVRCLFTKDGAYSRSFTATIILMVSNMTATKLVCSNL